MHNIFESILCICALAYNPSFSRKSCANPKWKKHTLSKGNECVISLNIFKKEKMREKEYKVRCAERWEGPGRNYRMGNTC